jgi:hypothetical protein
MLSYSIFGLAVDSDFELAEPPRRTYCKPDIVIHRGEVVNPCQKTDLDEEFVNIPSIGLFQIRGGREIIAQLHPRTDLDVLRVLLSGRLMAYLMRQRGWLPLHASAVEVGTSAVLFLAAVGMGKSTTAATFHACGHSVLTDDVSPVRIAQGQPVLCGGQSRLRLCEDAAFVFRALDPTAGLLVDKHLFQFAGAQGGAIIPLARIYLLTDGDTFSIAHVPAVEAVTALGRECFVRLSRAGSRVMQAHLRDCAEFAKSGTVRRLVRPRGLEKLANLVELVERDVCE